MSGPDPGGQPPPASALTPLPPQGPGAPAVVAFYLPQYHQIPENDEWWGEGFTDWRNVMAAKPLYPGHAIPNLPGELGAYDLLSRDVRSAQAELAREYGVYGFCYYFYWFGGRRLLERPLELMLADGEPSVPFCLCWANEPWTRRWDGRESDVLMPQRHDRVRDLAILDDLMPYFEDERYIRIDGRPLLLIYRQSLLDRPERWAAELRAVAVRRGLPGLYLCNVMSIGDTDRVARGFDAAVEFPPNGTIGKEIRPRDLGADPAFKGKIYDYASVVQTMLARPIFPFPYFPGVMPRWDNTARKGTAAHVFRGSTPELFERWLRRAALISRLRNDGAPLVFVNSWNEWAEGAHLEPDRSAGPLYLAALPRVASPDSGRDSDSTEATRSGPVPTTPTAADLPCDELVSGLPSMADDIDRASPPGVGWIESVDGRPLCGRVVRASRNGVLRLGGWFCGDPRRSGRQSESGSLTLVGETETWSAPVRTRVRRPDLQRAMLARNRRSRRVIRTVDRLPPFIGRWVLRLWSGRHDWYGFEVPLRIGSIATGRYEIGFLEVTSGGLYVISTDFVLEVI